MRRERVEGERILLRVHVGESDKWKGKSVYEAILELLRNEGFSGATVLRGVGGYGSSGRYHTDKILRLAQGLPIVIESVESAERVERILPKLEEMLDGGLITLETVKAMRYRSGQSENVL